ncbi:nucleotidyl transferase AbiEii/AbiGii toxin family protein [Patescibacteria group bacterium]|nr:nucleotidyl transferase AbiEii/AbiGii toxin family protein [Patescibacteria group bacterium]MBU2036405.1 nucleotidyl transferase AbiEii/AbiGii toxin family protein [Patescibacteria group bacterium]
MNHCRDKEETIAKTPLTKNPLRKGNQTYFKGETATRLLFNSPRFSEDLDFSTTHKNELVKKIKSYPSRIV